MTGYNNNAAGTWPVPAEGPIRVSFAQPAAARVLRLPFLHLPGRRDGCAAAEEPIRVNSVQHVAHHARRQIRNRYMRSRRSPIRNNRDIRSRGMRNKGTGNSSNPIRSKAIPNKATRSRSRRILPGKARRQRRLHPL